MKAKIITGISILLLAACSATAQNLLQNGGIEASIPNGTFPASGWLPSWYPTTAGSVTTTTAARTGKCGLWMYTSNGNSNSLPSQVVACTPGRNYKAEVYLRSPQGQAWTAGTECFISLTYLNSSNTEIQVARSESLKAGNTDWKLFTVSCTAPKGSSRVILMINLISQNGQSICNADDCSLSQLP